MNILLVEDSATVRRAMQSHITVAGHQCVTVESGEQAMQILDPDLIDMIIIDVQMPGLDGFETTRLIREQFAELWIPIIFVTGDSDEQSFKKGIEVGGDDYLIKPISPVILQAKIKAMQRLVNMRDQMHKMNKKLRELGDRDGLTGLFNRRSFDQKAAEAWRHAARHKKAASILLIDIDHFKQYNQRYGHLAGDECLKAVAKCVSELTNRSDDISARYSSEQFIILLPETDFDGAEHLAETLRESVERLDIRHGISSTRALTVSIGGASLHYTTGCQVSTLINSAQKSLRESKYNGRNCAHVTDYNNLHSALMIEHDMDMKDEIIPLLQGHCEITEQKHANSPDAEAINNKPELVILTIENELDVSIVLYKKLKESTMVAEAPLLVLSPLGADRLKRLSLSLGAKSYLSTPLDQHQLIARIDEILLKPAYT
ncbi:diguanylate cyclase [Agaribacterium sp. ZY112]|uniref:diguanylate cyclase n=1 Tax=Agaribacterium sp. ZY112 TaxID=3233574 RepID=UPI0035239C68